nr:MAG TPA: hypothetical protein [Caudoviricetes sp.]
MFINQYFLGRLSIWDSPICQIPLNGPVRRA